MFALVRTLVPTRLLSKNFRTMSVNTGTTTNDVDLGAMRKPYNDRNTILKESDLVAKEPIGQFKSWFELACQTPGIAEANAMCLSTATKSGMPSGRIVLLKGFSDEGFRFFTNYSSRKGMELEENPYAALTFYWEPLKKSVRIEGRVKKLSPEISAEYFHSRPRGNQIGATISPQSKPIASRQVLDELEEKLTKEYADESKIIPLPGNWGGYVVIPEAVEFWQGQSTRIHDRIRFRRPSSQEPDGILTHQGDKGWIYERLAP